MGELVRLHALRWRERGESGVLADPLLGGFLRDAAPELAGAGLLRLWRSLRAGDDRGAAGSGGATVHHYYIGGFDPAYGGLSPSAALIGAAMAQAHARGRRNSISCAAPSPTRPGGARWCGRPGAGCWSASKLPDPAPPA